MLSRPAGALAALLAFFSAAAPGNAMNLSLVDNYEGESFFNQFVFNASVIDNTTQGNIQ